MPHATEVRGHESNHRKISTPLNPFSFQLLFPDFCTSLLVAVALVCHCLPSERALSCSTYRTAKSPAFCRTYMTILCIFVHALKRIVHKVSCCHVFAGAYLTRVTYVPSAVAAPIKNAWAGWAAAEKQVSYLFSTCTIHFIPRFFTRGIICVNITLQTKGCIKTDTSAACESLCVCLLLQCRCCSKKVILGATGGIRVFAALNVPLIPTTKVSHTFNKCL